MTLPNRIQQAADLIRDGEILSGVVAALDNHA